MPYQARTPIGALEPSENVYLLTLPTPRDARLEDTHVLKHLALEGEALTTGRPHGYWD